MDATGDTGKATAPEQTTAPEAQAATPAPTPASDHAFGPDGAAILATEHWSLLANRSLIWNEAMSRATVFLGVLSASTIALALVADATGFGPQTTTLALVLLPVVLLLGIAAHGRLVEINRARDVLYQLARSPRWWERRIAMFATLAFVRAGDLDDTFALAERLVHDQHDLVQKVVGGMLREAGKHDRARLLGFLDTYAAMAPRVLLRDAIEHLDPEQRAHYLGLKAQAGRASS